jgi:hypothetical protein
MELIIEEPLIVFEESEQETLKKEVIELKSKVEWLEEKIEFLMSQNRVSIITLPPHAQNFINVNCNNISFECRQGKQTIVKMDEKTFSYGEIIPKEFITQFKINDIVFSYLQSDSNGHYSKFKHTQYKKELDIISSFIEKNTDVVYKIIMPSHATNIGSESEKVEGIIGIVESLKGIQYKHIKELQIHYYGNLEHYKNYMKNIISKKVFKKITWMNLDT